AYTKTDKKKNKWCQVFIVKSTISKGSIEADFESEWQDLAVKNYNPSEAPVCRDTELADGWKVKTGVAKFIFNNADAMVMVTSFSGYDRCLSVVAISNSDVFTSDIARIMESVEMVKPSTTTALTQTTTVSAGDNNFAFSTTNFDDGWVSTVHEDWVEVTKGSMKVLLHYPKDG